RAVGEVDGARAAEPALAIAGELALLGRDRERARVVEARAVTRAHGAEGDAAEATEEAEDDALVGDVRPGLLLSRPVLDLEPIPLAAFPAPEHAALARRGPILVVDAENR